MECYSFNSLAPGRSECDSKNVIFNLVLLIGISRSSYGNALQWMPQDLTDDESTLVQVMAWCRQATSHYLSQCLPRSLSPYGVTRPRWVNANTPNYHSGLYSPQPYPPCNNFLSSHVHPCNNILSAFLHNSAPCNDIYYHINTHM